MKVQSVMCLLGFVLLSSCSAIQQRKKNIESFKELAFCRCVTENYSLIDSTFSQTYQDLSLSVIFSGRPLSMNVWDSLSVYSGAKTYGAYPMTSHTTDQVGGISNFISLSCLEFYKSKELDSYIKRLMKADHL